MMFSSVRYLFILIPTLMVSACGGDAGTNTLAAQGSAIISYTNASQLGSGVNDPFANDASPEISSNGLELYFHSDRAGGEGGFDLWRSTRASTIVAWGTATPLRAPVNSASNEESPTLSADGLTLIFASDLAGDLDLYVSTRVTLNDSWMAPIEIPGLINTTTYIESGPSLSSDGLTLFFHSDAPGLGNTDLYVSIRPSVTDPWGSPAILSTDVNSGEFEYAPEISSDGLSLYFHSTRATRGLGPVNIWRATRARVGSRWVRPTALPAPVNTTNSETAPSLSDDWQTLYFSSSASGNGDIWQAVP